MTNKTQKGRNGGELKVGGQNGGGRPKNLVSGVTDDLQKEGYKPVTSTEVQMVYKVLLQLPESRLKAIVADGLQPMLLRIVAKSMLGGKGFEVIEKMLDRSHGRAANVLSLQRNEGGEGKENDGGKDDTTTFTGINIVVVGGVKPPVNTEADIEKIYGGN